MTQSLIIQTAFLGDVVLATPLMAALAPDLTYAPILLALGLIAVLANLTALERIHAVYSVARGVPLDEPAPRATDPTKGNQG